MVAPLQLKLPLAYGGDPQVGQVGDVLKAPCIAVFWLALPIVAPGNVMMIFVLVPMPLAPLAGAALVTPSFAVAVVPVWKAIQQLLPLLREQLNPKETAFPARSTAPLELLEI